MNGMYVCMHKHIYAHTYIFNFYDSHWVNDIYILNFYTVILVRIRTLYLKTILKTCMGYLCYDIQQIYIFSHKIKEFIKEKDLQTIIVVNTMNFTHIT